MSDPEPYPRHGEDRAIMSQMVAKMYYHMAHEMLSSFGSTEKPGSPRPTSAISKRSGRGTGAWKRSAASCCQADSAGLNHGCDGLPDCADTGAAIHAIR